MSCMRDIRKRTDRTDSMFEPLKASGSQLSLSQHPGFCSVAVHASRVGEGRAWRFTLTTSLHVLNCLHRLSLPQDTVALLHSFGIQMNENVLQQLENADFEWNGLKKKMLNRREQLASLQQAEVGGAVCSALHCCAGRLHLFAQLCLPSGTAPSPARARNAAACTDVSLGLCACTSKPQAIEIRRKSDAFNERVEDFRKFFLKNAPFATAAGELKLEQVKPAYVVLDNFHHGRSVRAHAGGGAAWCQSKMGPAAA